MLPLSHYQIKMHWPAALKKKKKKNLLIDWIHFHLDANNQELVNKYGSVK
jgi:hypothetical protein